jgi:multiple sugar transport system substrate-binding protein
MLKKVSFYLTMGLLLVVLGTSVDAAGTPKPSATNPLSMMFWHTEARPHRVERYEQLFKRFSEKYPQYAITSVLRSGTDIQNIAPTAVMTGKAPDFLLANSALTHALLETGAVQPLDDLIKDLNKKHKIIPAMMETLTFNKHVYAAPVYTSSFLLHYRKDMFEKAGLDPNKPPTTWPELLKTAEALKKSGVQYPIGVPGAIHAATDQLTFSLMCANGAQHLTDASGENVIFNNPRTVEAFDFYAKLYQYTPPGSETWKWDEPRIALYTGVVAMVMEKGHYIKGWIDHGQLPLSLLGSGYMPRPENGKLSAMTGNSGYVLLTKDPAKKEAFSTFMKWLYEPENMAWLILMDPGFFLPVTEDVLASPAFRNDPVIKQKWDAVQIQLETLPTSYVAGFTQKKVNPKISAVTGSNVFAQVAQRIVIGKMSAPDAVAWGQKTMEELLKD